MSRNVHAQAVQASLREENERLKKELNQKTALLARKTFTISERVLMEMISQTIRIGLREAVKLACSMCRDEIPFEMKNGYVTNRHVKTDARNGQCRSATIRREIERRK